jgi:hypothetical protein
MQGRSAADETSSESSIDDDEEDASPLRLILLDFVDPDDNLGSHSKPNLLSSRIRKGVMVDFLPSRRSLYCLPVRTSKCEKDSGLAPLVSATTYVVP